MESRNQEIFLIMAPRSRLRRATGAVLVILLAAGAAFVVRQLFFAPKIISAYFSTATAIYAGDQVRVAGVKVGTIDAIESDGTKAKLTMSVDRDVPIPADVKAVIVASNLISARYVQLTPPYVDNGPQLRNRAVIPLERTAVPVEWDEVKRQLMRLATDLGPQSDVSGTSISRFIDSAANALGDGNGVKLRETLSQLSGTARILAEGSGDITNIVKNLQTFVTALRDSGQQIVLFQNRLATLTSVINDSRSDLDAALNDLSTVVQEVTRFVAGSRNETAEQLSRLRNVTQNLVDSRASIENLLHVAPTELANSENIYNPAVGTVNGSLSLNNFSNPVWFLCSMVGAIEDVTSRETGKLCGQYLGPAARQFNFNNLPLQTNPFLMPTPRPEKIIYTDPNLAPGGNGWTRAPEPPPAISAYTGLNEDVAPRIPAPPPAVGPNPYAPPPGVQAGPIPAQYPGSPMLGPPTILPGPPTTDRLLLPDAVAPTPPSAAGAPQAEGTPPA